MNKHLDFLKGKGFYLALSLCVVAAALSCFWAVRNVAQRMNETTSQTEQGGTKTWDLPGAQVEQKVEDVPKNATNSRASSQRSSSQSGSAEQSQVDENSGASVDLGAPSFVKPVSGEVSQVFSGDELVYSKTLNDWRTHNGVDIACASDATVKSAVAGKVVNMYEDGLWGQVVEVESGELLWRYTGVDKTTLSVNVGDAVSAGQKLGKIGETTVEIGEGPHLHLEVLKGGNYVDPEHYFS